MERMRTFKNWIASLGDNKVYIYGGGIVAYYVGNWVSRTCVKEVSAFVVSDKSHERFNDYFGIPIISIYDAAIDENDGIVIATLPNIQDEIRLVLDKLKMERTYYITKKEYNVIRNESPNSDAEILRLCHIVLQNEKRLSEKIIHNRSIQLENEKKINNLEKALLAVTARVKEQNKLLKGQNCIYNGYEFDLNLYNKEYSEWKSDESKMKSDIDNLIIGLDESSRNTVLRIVSRLWLNFTGNIIRYDDEETKQLERVENEFYSNVYRINENHFFYKCWDFVGEKAEQPSLYYEHGINTLSRLAFVKELDVIDAGGYIGDSALVFRKYINGKVYSFEGDYSNMQKLKRNVIANGGNDRIIPVNKVISDKCGYVSLYEGALGTNSSSIMNNMLIKLENSVTVESVTIDQFVSENNIKIGIIKTDVEGAEFKLLEGAKQTILSQKPILMISIYHSLNDFFYIKPWIEQLNMGYKFRIFRPILKGSFIAETMLICE